MAKRKTKGKWTKRQLKFMQMLADPLMEVNDKKIAAELKVKTETLLKWRRLPGFQRKTKKLAEAYLGNGWPAVLKELSKKAQDGNVQAIKMFMEYAERQDKGAQKESCKKPIKSNGEEFDIKALSEKDRKELQSAIIRRIEAIKQPPAKTKIVV